MIENTLSSIEKITGQLKTLNRIRKFLTLFLYSGYLVYRIVANTGYLALNVTLLSLTVLYATFYIYYVSAEKNSLDKETVKKLNGVYRWTKHILTGIGIGLNVSGFLAVADRGLTIQNLIFVVVMPAFFLLQIFFDILYEYANYCFKLIKKGFLADVENLKEKYEKPLHVVQSVRTTMGGMKNVKEGMAGLAASFLEKRRRKKAERKKPTSPVEVAATDEAPEVIEVQPTDLLPPPEDGEN